MQTHHCLLLVILQLSVPVFGQNDYERPFLRQQDNSPPDYLQERSTLTLNDKKSEEYDYIYDIEEEKGSSYIEPDTLPRKEEPSNSNSLKRRPHCSSVRRTIPHEKYCDKYYLTTECENDGSILRSCPNGLSYAGSDRFGLIDVCDYPHSVNCRGKEMNNPPISTEHCDWLYGIFGHETSCTRYWTCWNGTATEQFCVGGLLYNEETHACDWPQNVVGCQKHPLCKDDANGNVPLGKSCNRYWACQGGYPRLQRCPAMLVFDKIRKRCISPPTADCDIPATTPASVPHIGKEAVAKAKHLKRTGVRRRNNNNNNNGGGGIEERKSSIPIQDNDALSNSLSGAEPAFSIPQGATLIGGSGGGGFSE
ncbi:uncharacterized protein [Lepeophtheirus salmonis]|nr:uncharacterized protein LOC121124109 isoform X1 [Lepeophtheirus salmonis]